MSTKRKDVLDMFTNAPSAPVASKPKGKTKERDEVELGPDLDTLAALKIVERAMGEVASQLERELKERVSAEFAARAISTGTRPNSFVGIGPQSRASCELRKRGSNLSLQEALVTELGELGVAVERIEAIPERLVFNPEIVGNQDTMRLIAQAIRREPKLDGVQIVLRQEAQFHFAPSDTTIAQVAAKVYEPERMKRLLEGVCVLAMGKYNLAGADGDGAKLKTTALEIIARSGIL